MTLRIFNQKTHQWALYWINSSTGELFLLVVGGFNGGNTGEFYGDDTDEGRPIKVVFRWTRIHHDTRAGNSLSRSTARSGRRTGSSSTAASGADHACCPAGADCRRLRGDCSGYERRTRFRLPGRRLAGAPPPAEGAARRQQRMDRIRRHAEHASGARWRRQCERELVRCAGRRVSRCQCARVRREDTPVGDLVARRPRCATARSIRR